MIWKASFLSDGDGYPSPCVCSCVAMSGRQVVTLEAEAEVDVVAAVEALLASLPASYVVKVVDDDDLKDV